MHRFLNKLGPLKLYASYLKLCSYNIIWYI